MPTCQLFYRQKSQNFLYVFCIYLIFITILILLLFKNFNHYKIMIGPGLYEENRSFTVNNINISEIEHLPYIESINLISGTSNSYYILLDNYYSMSKFEEYLLSCNHNDYITNSTKMSEIYDLEKSEVMINFISTLGIILSFIILYLLFKKVFHNEEPNLALLKALGFNQFHILLYLIKLLLLLVFCTFLLLFFTLLIIKILCFFITTTLTGYITYIKISKFIILELIIFIILLLVFITEANLKIKKINIFQTQI